MHRFTRLARSALACLAVVLTSTPGLLHAQQSDAPAPASGFARIEHIDPTRATMMLGGHTYAIPPGLAVSVHGHRNVPAPRPQTGMHVHFQARPGSGATPPTLTHIEVIPD